MVNWNFDVTQLQAGVHTITVRARDAAGNVSPSLSHSFNIIAVQPLPPPITGGIEISHTWDNGIARTITGHGEFDPYNPKVAVAAGDNRMAYFDGLGHCRISGDRARIYAYYNNYNAQMTLRFKPNFPASGDDLSLKLRSRHNEGGTEANRFGGYGMSFELGTVGIKREDYHNVHTTLVSGKVLPQKMVNDSEYGIRFRCMNEGTKVRLTGWVDYGNGFVQVVDGYDDSPLSYALDRVLYDTKSYVWIRNNGASNSTKVSDVYLERL